MRLGKSFLSDGFLDGTARCAVKAQTLFSIAVCTSGVPLLCVGCTMRRRLIADSGPHYVTKHSN